MYICPESPSRGVVSFRKPIFIYPFGNFVSRGESSVQDPHLLARMRKSVSSSGGPVPLYADSPFNINDHCVMLMLIFSCGGAAGKFNTYWQVSPQITANRWGHTLWSAYGQGILPTIGAVHSGEPLLNGWPGNADTTLSRSMSCLTFLFRCRFKYLKTGPNETDVFYTVTFHRCMCNILCYMWPLCCKPIIANVPSCLLGTTRYLHFFLSALHPSYDLFFLYCLLFRRVLKPVYVAWKSSLDM